jgi:hypothetical protein
MSTFAEALVSRIRGEHLFWTDIEWVSSLAISRLIPGIQRKPHDVNDGFNPTLIAVGVSLFSNQQ